MAELFIALISILEILILGLFSMATFGYFIATFHPLKASLLGYYTSVSHFLYSDTSFQEYRKYIQSAIFAGMLYYGGILVNIVDYWFLHALHLEVIHEVDQPAEKQPVSPVNRLRTHGIKSVEMDTAGRSNHYSATTTQKEYIIPLSGADSAVYNKGLYDYVFIPVNHLWSNAAIPEEQVTSYKCYLNRSAHWDNNGPANAGESLGEMRKFIRLIRGTLLIAFLVSVIALLKCVLSLVAALLQIKSNKLGTWLFQSVIAVEKDMDKKARACFARVFWPNLLIICFAFPIYAVSVKSYVFLEREFHMTVIEGDNTLPVKEAEAEKQTKK